MKKSPRNATRCRENGLTVGTVKYQEAGQRKEKLILAMGSLQWSQCLSPPFPFALER